jgi:hypothetical protein
MDLNCKHPPQTAIAKVAPEGKCRTGNKIAERQSQKWLCFSVYFKRECLLCLVLMMRGLEGVTVKE